MLIIPSLMCAGTGLGQHASGSRHKIMEFYTGSCMILREAETVARNPAACCLLEASFLIPAYLKVCLIPGRRQ